MWFKIKNNFARGISTIELMVSIAIFVLISTAVLASYPQLSSGLSLDKTTQEIASSLHETRMYGIGVKSVLGTRPAGFGVHFDKSKPDSYILFSELNADKKYTSIGEKVSEYKISARETISDICLMSSPDTGEQECGAVSSDGSNVYCLSGGKIDNIDILFLRPAPSVFINGFGALYPAGICDQTSQTCAIAELIVKSPRGQCKKIEVWTTGQVSVRAPKIQ